MDKVKKNERKDKKKTIHSGKLLICPAIDQPYPKVPTLIFGTHTHFSNFWGHCQKSCPRF